MKQYIRINNYLLFECKSENNFDTFPEANKTVAAAAAAIYYNVIFQIKSHKKNFQIK